MHHRRKTTLVATVGVAFATVAATALATSGTALAAPTHQSAAGRTVVAGTGLSGSAAHATALAGSTRVGVSVFVGRDPAGLQALAQQVSDPSSALYRHHLTAAQVQARFGATTAQRAQVTAWLRAAGLTVSQSGAFVVSAQGTAAQAQSALQSPLDHVVLGTTRVMPAHDVSVPTALASIVDDVTLRGSVVPLGQHEAMHKVYAVVPGSPASQAFKERCSPFYRAKRAVGTPPAFGGVRTWAPCGYLPRQIAGAYGVTASHDTGKGVTVGILSDDNDSTAEADANQWGSTRAVKPFASGQYTALIANGAYNGVGDVESALDVEAVHGMAPDAGVVYSVGNGNITGDRLLDGFAQIVTAQAAQVVTSSWYDGYIGQVSQSLIKAWQGYLAQAATEGISVDFATGDYSDTTPLQYPGSDPMITTVGGTSLAIGAENNNMWEAPWATDEANLSSDGKSWVPAPPGSYAEGGTGGISTVFAEPSWQKGVVSNAIDPNHMRAVPDVSALGDWNLGYQIGYTNRPGGSYVEGMNGGTSLSSPLFAGIEADAIQHNGGTSLGFANPTFYQLYGSSAFHDVIQYPRGKSTMLSVVYGPGYGQNSTLSVMAMCQSTVALVCGKGYDTVAGVGSPTPSFFSAFDN